MIYKSLIMGVWYDCYPLRFRKVLTSLAQHICLASRYFAATYCSLCLLARTYVYAEGFTLFVHLPSTTSYAPSLDGIFPSHIMAILVLSISDMPEGYSTMLTGSATAACIMTHKPTTYCDGTKTEYFIEITRVIFCQNPSSASPPWLIHSIPDSE